MTDVGYLAAFLGGLLALLSPCSALLVPSFFAYAFSSRGRLLANTGVFYLGLAATLVPLGAGSAAVTGLVNGHRQALVQIAGWVIIVLGAAQLFGGGFAFRPAVNLQQRFLQRGGLVAVFGLGATYGLASFCSGPILGAVLTIAAVGGQALRGVALLAVYALGMAAPLFCLAALWQRFDLDHRRWLRGREFRVGRLRLHTTSTVSGLLFMVIGVLLLVFDGTATLGLLGLAPSTDSQLEAQSAVRNFSSHVPDGVLLGAIALIIAAIAVWQLRRQPSSRSSGTDANSPERDSR